MKIRKIALVEMSGIDTFNIYAPTKTPRGTPLLAAVLQENGYQATCYIESIKGFSWRRLMDYDMVGFGIITCTANPTYRLIRKLRSKGYMGQIFVGGPHATELPLESLEAGATFVVRHEGEKTLLALIEALNSGACLDNITGISWIKNGVLSETFDRNPLTEEELSVLPLPAFDSIFGGDRINLIPFMFSRSCPYDCEFCGVRSMFGKYRRASIDWCVNQVRQFKEKYPKLWKKCRFFFVDDNLFGTLASKRFTIEFLKRLIAEDLVPPRGYVCQARVDDITTEIADLLKKSNCSIVCLGIESADPATLKLLNKCLEVEDIRRGLEILHKAGIRTLAMTIAGTDIDTFWSFWRSIRQLQKWHITYLQVLALVLLVGTKLTKRMEAEGREYDHNYDKANGEHATLKPKKMSKFEVWACVYLIGFAWFYLACSIFSLDLEKKILILVVMAEIPRQIGRNIRNWFSFSSS